MGVNFKFNTVKQTAVAKEMTSPNGRTMASYVHNTPLKILPIKILLNIYVYAHKLLLLSTLAREASLCCGQQLQKRLRSSPRTENKSLLP